MIIYNLYLKKNSKKSLSNNYLFIAIYLRNEKNIFLSVIYDDMRQLVVESVICYNSIKVSCL